jgi:hypothetical protein
MSKALFPVLAGMARAAGETRALRNVVAAAAEGYAFPTNLDVDQPVDGLAPPSQADLLLRAVREGWPADTLAAELDAYTSRRRSI